MLLTDPLKQNKFLPGSHIPIVSEDRIIKLKPDYVIIFLEFKIRNNETALLYQRLGWEICSFSQN